MESCFKIQFLALVLSIFSYTLAESPITHPNQIEGLLSFQPDFAIEPSIACNKPFERPTHRYRGDNPIASNDIAPMEEAPILYPPVQLKPSPPQSPVDYNLNSGYQYQNIAHEFEVTLFENLSNEAYQKARIYFDAFKKLLDDEVLLRQKPPRGLNNFSINSSVSFILPSNEFFQTYIQELGFLNMEDFRVRDPRWFKEFMLSYTIQGLYPIEELFYFYEKSATPLRTPTGIRLEVGDNCTEVFINGVKIVDTEVATYNPDYAGFFFIHFLEKPLVPNFDRELVKYIQ